MADTTLVQMRVPEDLLAAIDGARGEESRTAWVLAAAELALSAEASAEPPPLAAAPTAAPRSIGTGIPSPGVACAWGACWARDTSRYGVTDPAELTRGGYRERPRDENKVGIVLCPAHAALLEGREYRSPAAARAGRLAKSA